MAEGRMGSLPLVVGVTGHRDLHSDDLPYVAAEVRRLFDSLRSTCPHTPIILLSSLAEGADRLVARIALDAGIELYAVLPLPVELYERDFESAQSVSEFHELMKRSYDAVVVPSDPESRQEAVEDLGPARDRRYANAGAFVVSYSQIVIALWDGTPNEMLGGTSQIVRFALEGVPMKYLGGHHELLRTSETGAVYHICVNRHSSGSGRFATAAKWLYPGAGDEDAQAIKSSRAALDENLRNLERFNRDAGITAIERQARSSAESLLPSMPKGTLSMDPAVLNYTRAVFGQADALAIRCRKWTHAAMISIFFAIGIAAVLFSLYAALFPHPALYGAFLGVVAIAFCIDVAESRQRMQDRFQDYRALAEGLRVQFYWRLAGIQDSVYDHYLARQEGELDWIRNAMRAASFRKQIEPNQRLANDELNVLLAAIVARWIKGEGTYFSRAVGMERKTAARIKASSGACLLITAVVALILTVTLAHHVSPTVHSGLVMMLTLTLAGAGLLTGYAQKRAHEEHARRYLRMRDLYRVAGERVAMALRNRDVAAARLVLVQVGREALAETCDWLLLHRERQVEVPTA